MKRYLYILLFATLAACAGDDMYDNSPDGPLELSQDHITVGKSATTVNLGVTAREATWTLSGVEDWFSINPSSGPQGITTIVITFTENADPNPEPDPDDPPDPDPDDPEPEPDPDTDTDTEPQTRATETRTATLTFSSGGVTKTVTIEQLPTDVTPPVQSPEYDVNKQIHEDLLNVWYYNGETRNAKADYNQSYKNFYESYLKTLTRNTLEGNTWSQNNDRYLYSYIERDPSGLNYGMEFDLGNYDGKLVGRILYVEPEGPAAQAGLKRGDWFWKVNDQQMFNQINTAGRLQYNDRIDTLVNPIADFSPKLGMLTFRPFAAQLLDEGRTVTLTPTQFKGNPILGSQLIRQNNLAGEPTLTGYLMLNSFEPGYETEITSIFAGFKEGAVTSMILDLRYNKTGTAATAELVGNLIVPAEAAEMTFARYEFADGEAADSNHISKFEPHESSIGVPLVFVLTSSHTSGAAELLINALRGLEPVVKVVVVGDVTEGMNVGMVHKRITATETGHQYDVWMAAWRTYNANGDGNYGYGLTPNGGTLNEWQGDNVLWSDTWEWKGWEGATEDPLLERAMEFVRGISPLPTSRVLDNPSRKRSGFPRQFSVKANMLLDNE